MADDEPKQSDNRKGFLRQQIRSNFSGLADNKFDKAWDSLTEESVEAIDTFLQSGDAEGNCLMVSGEGLTCTNGVSKTQGKTKAVVFVKVESKVLTNNIQSEVRVHEITPTAVTQLQALLDEIYLPLITNPHVQDGWGDVVSSEVTQRVHGFIANTDIAVGQTKGLVTLPLPPAEALSETADRKSQVALLEGSIITWTNQIKNVLKMDPETPLKKGLNPTPDYELDFWRAKAAHLNAIFAQLTKPALRQSLRLLEGNKSTYTQGFALLCKQVFLARLEANDNAKYLRTLEDWFNDLGKEGEFANLTSVFKPLMHIILLIWKNSKHYNLPNRLMVLVREICNILIEQACNFVNGKAIFDLVEQEETEQAVEQVKTCLRVCGAFKKIYFDYKTTANAECPSNPWRIPNAALFVRLDCFLERCSDVFDLTQTIMQFDLLAKVEIGGTKGKALGETVTQIYSDFQNAVHCLRAVDYDIMDVGAKDFDNDFYVFRQKIKELERQLGSVLAQAFDDSNTIISCFKLIDSFEHLLARPIIHDALEKHYVKLVQDFGSDLQVVQQYFVENRDTPPVQWNLPKVIGAVFWCRSLYDRISEPMRKMRGLHESILSRDESKEVCKLYASVSQSLQDYENHKVEEWGRDVHALSTAKLKLPLLVQDDSKQLSVNFDPLLTKLLREVRYFLLLGIVVPDAALEVYKHAEFFRVKTGNLDLIVDAYNSMLDTILPVEAPLFTTHFTKMDGVLKNAIGKSGHTWLDRTDIANFITEAKEEVETSHEVLRTLKKHMNEVQDTLSGWNEEPMFERTLKPVSMDDFERTQKALKVAKLAAVKEGSHHIGHLMKESNGVLKISVGHLDWKAYVDFMNDIVVEGACSTVRASMAHMLQQVDLDIIEKEEKSPMIEIDLTLKSNTTVQFKPALSDPESGRGVRDAVNGWIDNFFTTVCACKRLDTEGGFMREVHSDYQTQMLISALNETLDATETKCEQLREEYESYSELWLKDIDDEFVKFLEGAIVETEHGTKKVDLDQFDAEIKRFTVLDTECAAKQAFREVGWLRINTESITSSIHTWARKWIYKYTSYLQEDVTSKLSNLHDFMGASFEGLSPPVEEGDDEALNACLMSIRSVQKVKDSTVAMFEPLRESLLLLKREGVNIDDIQVADMDLQDYLEEVPLRWDKVINATYRKKEDILPLQTAKVEVIREELDQFFLEMRQYRNTFRANAPFKFKGTVAEAYSQMETFEAQTQEKIAAVKEINKLEDLFELSVSKYPETADTLTELKLLKNLWDMKSCVTMTFKSWRTALWADVDTETLDDANKVIMKELRANGNANPMIKGWEVYRDIEGLVKNMAVVLPLINDLHSPAMRDRHWKTMAGVCGLSTVLNPDEKGFSLNDMISLELHTKVDDIEEIVETANKELKIEKKMVIIEDIWRDLTLEYVPHKESEISLIRPSEEVIENLEGHQLELQGIIGMGKFVDYFRDRVMLWQTQLGEVEEVIAEWSKVCRSWSALESIFLASADIRAQLPDDTKRFEGIDSEFKDLMKEAVNITNVIEVCCAEGRCDLLKDLTKRLELCQKSLNEYLDVKKTIFPRFYFVSNVALLEILSNGNNPPKIMPFIGDCYDSLKKLIQPDPEKEPEFKDTWFRSGHTMVAKDGEVIKLPEMFKMEGAVEDWLNLLTEAMRECLKSQLDKALELAAQWEVEKPRQLWLFDWPAQVVLTGTQIFWTEETEQCLEEYEGGQEDAPKRNLTTIKARLDQLIKLVLGKLEKADRRKIIALITLDVHSRDVVARLIDEKASGPTAFLWAQQLRQYWYQPERMVNIKITDYQCKYFYEWVGNTGRLVITPLTDRCYITLTMALRLYMGGAPAGPAGTGKTETTKDLARCLAIPCYVFNCSDQMNFQTLGDIFRGLCQAGAWGCFDEFNRISIEVLSVVATQVKTIQDAIVLYSVVANRAEEYQSAPPGAPPVPVGFFEFMGSSIELIPTCGFWITMNPGYAGRTELPENLKALFRSCAMIRPDLKPICENMLMSEGFLTAAVLAIKFVTLYKLCSELLSPQVHYDWGLRAVKSVLRVAGTLKRGDPDWPEMKVLMRALRDFNTPKIPAHDTPVFLRLINDLFMGIVVEPKSDPSLMKKCVRACKERGLQHDDGFVLKVCQFQELLDVRHSVMLLGPTGCGKTKIWGTLADCHNLKDDYETQEPGSAFKPKSTCVYEQVNPKSVITNELYGYMTLAKDWKDGCLSIIMRGMSKCFPEQSFHEYQTYKWSVLDGDIDALWIESMNTVMDDNKVLTLVSNERIPLSDAMRMVFEINSLKNASPATVSRAGILYINEGDIGWRPFMETWVSRREDEQERNFLPGLFDKYIDPIQEFMRKGYKKCTPIRILGVIQTVCFMLQGCFDDLDVAKKSQEVMEEYFIFAVMWAFGGPLIVDVGHGIDSRRDFHEMFTATFSNTRFPNEGLCFDYTYDLETNEWVHWSTRVPGYEAVAIGNAGGQKAYGSISVQTVDSVRLTWLTDCLAKNQHHVMFVGNAGTGKTTMVNNYLASLDEETYLSTAINMNYYSDSKSFQTLFDQNIDKRSGKIFGPPATKRMIFFIDDLNLPYIEEYGTQNSLELMRQIMDHGSIFDRADLGFRKEIVDCQQIAAMNPLIGSFSVSERNQRCYSTFACLMPSQEDLTTIYENILGGHFKLGGFEKGVVGVMESIVQSAIHVHTEVLHKFLPSAIRFVYNWNMRELSNVFQGLCLSEGEFYTKPVDICRLWLHECYRVFSDRMVNEEDVTKFTGILQEVTKKEMPTINSADLFAENLFFTNFASITAGPPKYLPIKTMNEGETPLQSLNTTLTARLQEYNETYAQMNLVLFQDAMQHIIRITRIISNPRGNAMLIGVGGSGKQSLTRLASFICGYETSQLSVTSNFKVDDLKESLKELYKIAGVKGVPTTFLMTDTQIVNEKFLVYLNDMLSSGWIPDLFEKDEMGDLFGGLRNEAKANGIPDTPKDMLKFFLKRVVINLHVVLAFSPVGDAFRVRARRFPGLINCTAIDWFHPWPEDALISVALRFVANIELPGEESDKERIQGALSRHMAMVHLSVGKMSAFYLKTQRRYNYVTPKSFLELIDFYKVLMDQKRSQVQGLIDRLDVGLSTLRKTAADVAELQVDLTHTMEKVAEKKASTDILIQNMGVETTKAEAQQEVARVEEVKAGAASAKAAEIEVSAEKELSQAKPAMEAAAAAVDCLSKAMLSELKNLQKPPAGVDVVTKACLIMLEGEYKNFKWDRAKKMMANVDKFKEKLQKYRGEDMPENVVEMVGPICATEGFTPEDMLKKSAAASNLCTWVVNIYGFNRIYVKVKPLMDSLEQARKDKAEAEEQLATVKAAVAAVEAKLQELQNMFEQATAEKQAVEAQAEACTTRIGLAHRLVGGLSSENERWGNEIEALQKRSNLLVGDVMLAAAFVSYVGAFDKALRNRLWVDTWQPDIREKGIPLSEGVDPLSQLTDDANNARMMQQGLPSDRVSIENGSVIVSCKRWPLMIDPQLQAIKWLRNKEADNGLVVLQLTQKRWLNALEHAISNGTCIIIENLGEEVDATLDPVLQRAIYKKGRSLFLKLGGEEVEYDNKFQLYLQTKLANPHYKPEIAAQCTLINFIATEEGLEDQLLQKVVKEEQPDLEQQKQELVAAFQSYKIQLHQLEDNLLERLANAPDDILSDVPLIEGLEETKAASTKINAAVEKGKITEVKINKAREVYRKAATEGAMLYFMLTNLCTISHMYQFSLDSYMIYFFLAIKRAVPSDKQTERVLNLRESMRFTIFQSTCRGLFEAHKLVFLSQLTFQLITRGILTDVEVKAADMAFLMRAPKKAVEDYPVDWLPAPAWQTVQALGELEEFQRFPGDMVEASPRFREWYNAAAPETEKLPLDWSGLDKTPFLKMLVIRALRPDRMTIAVRNFCEAVLPNGTKYSQCDSTLSTIEVITESFETSTTTTPMFFILSPGVDVVAEVDKLGVTLGMEKGITYHNVSMGQGQDVVAMDKLEQAHRNGHWVILNNIHLMPKWCVELEKKLDEYALEGSHQKYRLFLTADPSNGIPIGILNRSIKLTNEPPAGLKANLKRAFCSFPKEAIDEADSKTKSIIFGLSHFHAVLMERKSYGPMGYNMNYPFSLGDLRDSSVCLNNYMESNGGGKIPWADLRYIFGEIMYGGHVVNDFDRLLVSCYLEWYMKDELLEETELYPFAEDEKGLTFRTPLPTAFDRYLEHIETELTVESPVAFGLHTNAEIDFRTTQSNTMFTLLGDLQQAAGAGGGGGGDDDGNAGPTPTEISAQLRQEILDAYAEKKFDGEDIARSLEEQGPYQNVFLQEIEMVNRLLAEMMRSLKELGLGFAGELTMSDDMETLSSCLFLDRVPPTWNKNAWPSKRGLTSWLANLLQRLQQLEEWTQNPMEIPKVTWLAGLIIPQSFLTALCQVSAQKNQQELDKLLVQTDVSKKMSAGAIDSPARDGAYISGLSMQGARWDVQTGLIDRAKPKEMFCDMPIINARAVSIDKAEKNNIYFCPTYKTTQRGPTWVFSAQLKTKSPPARWVLAGVAMVFDST
jgi:dynein heavy chain